MNEQQLKEHNTRIVFARERWSIDDVIEAIAAARKGIKFEEEAKKKRRRIRLEWQHN